MNKISLFLALSPVLLNSAEARIQCDRWSYGYSGTFSCPSAYLGATRWCKEILLGTSDSWQEEGCATGATADRGYCVLNCSSQTSDPQINNEDELN